MALELVTTRDEVRLRELTLADAMAYFLAVDANREHLSQFGETTGDKYKSLEDVERSITKPLDYTRMRLGIWVCGGTFVGSINLTPEDADVAEIGYWIDARFGNRGYATIACTALSNFALLERGFEQVTATVHEANVYSMLVLERSGFRPVLPDIGRYRVRIKDEPS